MQWNLSSLPTSYILPPIQTHAQLASPVYRGGYASPLPSLLPFFTLLCFNSCPTGLSLQAAGLRQVQLPKRIQEPGTLTACQGGWLLLTLTWSYGLESLCIPMHSQLQSYNGIKIEGPGSSLVSGSGKPKGRILLGSWKMQMAPRRHKRLNAIQIQA